MPASRCSRRPHRLLPIVLIAVLGLGAAGDDDPPRGPSEISTLIEDQTLIITAGHRDSMTITGSPGPGAGPAIRCGWFGFSADPPRDVGMYQVFDPEVGRPYILWCWYLENLRTIPDNPVIVPYEPGLPGQLANDIDVSEFALASIEFETPTPVLNPSDAQIVGVESWLAIASRLDYDPVHANAGPVWVSVWPQLRDIVWDLDNGDTVTCTAESDAATLWEPGLDEATRECAYTYESDGRSRRPASDTHEITATVTWTILRRTFAQPSWRPWREFSLSATETVRVIELQAAID